MPHGYGTYIGPQGIQLSQGQQQRVLLARAWYRSPRFWVLDEATGALDTPAEDAVWENLGAGSPSHTIVFSSHNLRTVQRADRVVVLENGKVVEMGGHEELMGQRGVFYRLFQT